EIAPSLLYVNRLAFVHKGRVAGDHMEPPDPRQPGDDVLDNAVDKIFLLEIAAHIGERQYRDGRPVPSRREGSSRLVFRAPRQGFDRLLDSVDAHRPRDVLDTVFAKIGKPDR